MYSRHSLSRSRISQICGYLEVKLSPEISCSYFHVNTNFYVEVSNSSTLLILDLLRTYSVFEVRHILFNQPDDSVLWASSA